MYKVIFHDGDHMARCGAVDVPLASDAHPVNCTKCLEISVTSSDMLREISLLRAALNAVLGQPEEQLLASGPKISALCKEIRALLVEGTKR